MPIAIPAVLIALHALAAVVWVGGMFLAYTAVRPAAGALLRPPERNRLWAAILGRFFVWVWASVVVLLGTGLWLIFGFYGGMAGVGGYVHAMLLLGVVMMLLFAHIFFAPFRRLQRAVSVEDWPGADQQLGKIRRLVAVNLVLGLITVAIGSGGRLI